MTSSVAATPLASSVIHRTLVFVSGKGGVGKTVVSQAIALGRSQQGARTLWVTFEDPSRPMGELKAVGHNLWHLNCEPMQAFEEYAGLKIGTSRLTRIFIQNKLMNYLAKAAPGIHELVLLGKVWYERLNYDTVIVDMPSTGYGLAMFQSTENFARLFRGGPIQRDADAMLGTFRDPEQTGHLIVSLPEEMPLRESLELDEYLERLFPDNAAAFLVNRRFPDPISGNTAGSEPLATSIEDYVCRRSALENFNLRLWRDHSIRYGELGFIPSSNNNGREELTARLASQMRAKGYL